MRTLKEVSWDEAINFAADKFKNIQKKYGVNTIAILQELQMKKPGQKNHIHIWKQRFIPASVSFTNRLWLKANFGTSAGTQHFDSVQHCDVIMVIAQTHCEAPSICITNEKENQRRGKTDSG